VCFARPRRCSTHIRTDFQCNSTPPGMCHGRERHIPDGVEFYWKSPRSCVSAGRALWHCRIPSKKDNNYMVIYNNRMVFWDRRALILLIESISRHSKISATTLPSLRAIGGTWTWMYLLLKYATNPNDEPTKSTCPFSALHAATGLVGCPLPIT
jgi:hypothetical protein